MMLCVRLGACSNERVTRGTPGRKVPYSDHGLTSAAHPSLGVDRQPDLNLISNIAPTPPLGRAHTHVRAHTRTQTHPPLFGGTTDLMITLS